MKRSNRVNLSLTDRMYRAVSGYSELVGRTRTALIVEAMGHHLPSWEAAVRSHRYQERQASVPGEFGGVVSRHASVDGSAPSAVALNQKALWNLERERKAGEKSARRAKAAKSSKRGAR